MEVQNQKNELIEILMENGYDKERAFLAVTNVLQARITARERYLRNYLGKRIKAEFDGLLFEVIVKDVKINNEGKAEFQVTPLNGSKNKWISKFHLE